MTPLQNVLPAGRVHGGTGGRGVGGGEGGNKKKIAEKIQTSKQQRHGQRSAGEKYAFGMRNLLMAVKSPALKLNFPEPAIQIYSV